LFDHKHRMNARARGKWQGMLTILQFNWPFYVGGMLVMILSATGLFLLPQLELRIAIGLAFAGASYFVAGSLAISHFIYDRSDLYRWHWLERVLSGRQIHDAIFCHSGFDETSSALRSLLAGVSWQLLDHFDQDIMTEPSIRRARVMFPPTPGTQAARYDAWPLPAASADVVFGLLAIHELRSEKERRRWFAEARRCLHDSGLVVLVEHVRDAANLLAFGPGFLHFHSPLSWRRCWESAGFRCQDEFRVTPFVRIFLLTSP
jgi:hypothetical protein